MSISNKREVREHVKTLLEAYADGGHIDVEEMKTLTKDVADNVASLPVTAAALTHATLAALRAHLEHHATDNAAIIESLTSRLTAESATMTEEAGETGASAAHAASSSATNTAAPALSLSAFKARMAKKRDELKAEREIVTDVTSAGTSMRESARAATTAASVAAAAPTSAAPVAAEGAVTHTASAETDPTESRNLSTRPSAAPTPSLRPSASPAHEMVPDLADDTTSLREAEEVGTETHVQPPPSPQPPQQQPPKQQTVILTAAMDPEDEVDLYADIHTHRGRGSGRGRGRGRGRGGPFPFYPPPPNHYGPPPPHAYRGGYAPQPQHYRPY